MIQPVRSEGNISYNEKYIQTSAHSSLRASSMSVIRTTSKAMVRRKRQWNRNDREESVRSFTLERAEVFCVFGKKCIAQYQKPLFTSEYYYGMIKLCEVLNNS